MRVVRLRPPLPRVDHRPAYVARPGGVTRERSAQLGRFADAFEDARSDRPTLPGLPTFSTSSKVEAPLTSTQLHVSARSSVPGLAAAVRWVADWADSPRAIDLAVRGVPPRLLQGGALTVHVNGMPVWVTVKSGMSAAEIAEALAAAVSRRPGLVAHTEPAVAPEAATVIVKRLSEARPGIVASDRRR